MHWSHPSFGPLQPGAAAHERVEPPANHCDMAQGEPGVKLSFSCACPQSMRATFPPSRTKIFLSVHWGPIGSQLVMEFLQRTTPWMRITMNESRRKNHSTFGKSMSKTKHMQHIYSIIYYISTIGTEWNSGFCWRNWRSQETAIGCGEGFKDLSAQDLTSM